MARCPGFVVMKAVVAMTLAMTKKMVDKGKDHIVVVVEDFVVDEDMVMVEEVIVEGVVNIKVTTLIQ